MLPGPRFPVIAAGTLLISLALAGAAGADHPEDPLDHLDLKVDDIGPGQTQRVPIESLSHGELKAGWIYLVYGLVQGNQSLKVSLEHDHEPAKNTQNATWEPGYNSYYAKIAETGPHDLAIHNPGQESVRYGFYYDQSCNCEGKVIPLPGGVVMFNYPFPADTPVDISYPVACPCHLKGTLAKHDEDHPTASWPEDFQILQETEAQGPWNGRGDAGWLNFSFETDEQTTYYVHIEALQGGDPDAPVMLSPIIDTQRAGTSSEESPAPFLVPIVLAVLTLAVIRRSRLRGRFKRTG